MSPRQPEQIGRITFTGLEAARFWIRSLALQKHLDTASAVFANHPDRPKEHDRLSVPIISEYKVDDRLLFHYVIFVTVDALGLTEPCFGAVFYSSPARREQVIQHWNAMADYLMNDIQKEGQTGGAILIDPEKEAGRDL